MSQNSNDNKGFFKRIFSSFKERREKNMRMDTHNYFYFDKETGERKLLTWFVRFVNFFSVTLSVILFSKYMGNKDDDQYKY